MPMSRDSRAFMDIHPKHQRRTAARSLATLAALLLWTSARPAFAGPSAEWRYCYAGSEQSRRFYVSQPFSSPGSPDAVERQWIAWLGRQPVRYETTGCPRGADRAAVEASIASAARYNAGQGRGTVELDWQSGP